MQRFQFWPAAAIVPAVLYHVFRYLTLTYRFADREVVVRHGLVFRQERHIPYDRIDNVGLVQGPLHRLAGVAKVRLETAGSSQPEAELDVLSLAAVEHLRGRILAGRTTSPTSPISPARAVTDDHAQEPPEAAAAAPEVLVDSADQRTGQVWLHYPARLARDPRDVWPRRAARPVRAIDVDWLLETVESATEQSLRPFLVAGLAVAAVLLFLGLSVGWTILRFHGYRLERSGELLRVTCGLFTKVSAAVGRHRIQLVTVHESVLHRLFRRVSIRVATAGGVGEKSEISRKWFVPLVPRDQVARILNELRPGIGPRRGDWRPLARKAVRRKAVGNIVMALLFGAAGVVVLRWWGLLPIALLVAWAVAHAVLWTRRTRSR